jgi:NAD(P)-dependent dehydrogenase (short-subunit alcohol dehydrogenase family)
MSDDVRKLRRPKFNAKTFVDHSLLTTDAHELAANDALFAECAESAAADLDPSACTFSAQQYSTACRVLSALTRWPAARFLYGDDVAELRDLIVQLNAPLYRDQLQMHVSQYARSIAIKAVKTPSLDVVARRAERRIENLVLSLRQLAVPRDVLRSYVHTESRSIAFLSRVAAGRLPFATALQLRGPRGSSLLDDIADVGVQAADLFNSEVLDNRTHALAAADDAPPLVPAELLVDRDSLYSCSQCRHTFFDLSPHYAHCCPVCVDRNLMYRRMSYRLDGQVLLLTGARTKIGFATGVVLLNAGATLIVTSRFPFTTARRYASHRDAGAWATRLRVLGADFRDTATAELLCAFLVERLTHLDHLINNAAQTIRKPPAAWAQLVQRELALADAVEGVSEFERHATSFHREFVAFCERRQPAPGSPVAVGALVVGRAERLALHRSALATQADVCASDRTATVITDDDATRSWSLPSIAANGVLVDDADVDIGAFREALESAKSRKRVVDDENDDDNNNNDGRSQQLLATTTTSVLNLATDNADRFAVALPTRDVIAEKPRHTAALAMSDAVRLAREGDEPLDLRAENSWFKRLEAIELGEWMEVLTVNSAVPSLLCARLLPLLRQSALRQRHIVNVSSMEGKMTRRKLSAHPHTNAAKAALNMVTRTCAHDWALEHNVHMNSVDTGWVTDERPLCAQVAQPDAYPAELDEVDGAARVLQPIWRAVASEACEVGGTECCWAHRLQWQTYGNFLKNFAPTLW